MAEDLFWEFGLVNVFTHKFPNHCTIGTHMRRGFYFDIDKELLFKNEFSDLEEFDSRGLFSRNKTTVAKYVGKLYSHLLRQNVFAGTQELMDKGAAHEVIESINKKITEGCLAAEYKCRC